MNAHDHQPAPFVLARGRAILLGLLLVAIGGLAGAATTTIVYYYNGEKVEITPLSNGREQVRIYDESGEKTLDEVLEADEALFEIEEGPTLILSPLGSTSEQE
jgi:hypothetical protein